jgi:uncharacterized protein
VAATVRSGTFIIKVAGACNLNCSYCYVYNKGDSTYLSRPRVMDRRVATSSLQKIYGYAERKGLSRLALVLHGGEPLLVGKAWFSWFIEQARSIAPRDLEVEISLQTNGTLVDTEWLEFFSSEGIHLGVSMDGPPEVHDRYRVNFAGKGSYRLVRRSIDLLRKLGTKAPRWGVLVVSNPEFSGLDLYRHLLEIGVQWMDFLWPDFHHDSPPPWPPGKLGDFYIEIFDAWWDDRNPAIRIRWFETVMQMLLGGTSNLDAIGQHPLTEVVIETDGSIEPLDVLRTCGNGMTQLNLNVLENQIEDLYETELFKACIRNQELLSGYCLRCPVLTACGGGYMPHRWGRGQGFSNPSIHCVDLYHVITHIHRRMEEDISKAARDLQTLTLESEAVKSTSPA